jgi:hypothetical protein
MEADTVVTFWDSRICSHVDPTSIYFDPLATQQPLPAVKLQASSASTEKTLTLKSLTSNALSWLLIFEKMLRRSIFLAISDSVAPPSFDARSSSAAACPTIAD